MRSKRKMETVRIRKASATIKKEKVELPERPLLTTVL